MTANESAWATYNELRLQLGAPVEAEAELPEPKRRPQTRHNVNMSEPKPRPLRNLPQPGEVPLRAFMIAEASRLSVSVGCIFDRIQAGKYPDVKLRRVNRRVIYVTLTPTSARRDE